MEEKQNTSIQPEKRTKSLFILVIAVLIICLLYSTFTSRNSNRINNKCGDYYIDKTEQGYKITQNSYTAICTDSTIYTCETPELCAPYMTTSLSPNILFYDNSAVYSYNVDTKEKQRLDNLSDDIYSSISTIHDENGDVIGIYANSSTKTLFTKYNVSQKDSELDYTKDGVSQTIDHVCQQVYINKNYISCDTSSHGYLLSLDDFSTSLMVDNNTNSLVGLREFYLDDKVAGYVALIYPSTNKLPDYKTHDQTSILTSFLIEKDTYPFQFYNTSLQPITDTKAKYYYLNNNSSLYIYSDDNSYFYTFTADGKATKSNTYKRVLDAFVSDSLQRKYSTDSNVFFSVITEENTIKIISTNEDILVSFPDIIPEDSVYSTTNVQDGAGVESCIGIMIGNYIYYYYIDKQEFGKEDLSYLGNISNLF